MNDTLKADAERFSEFLVANYPPSRQWANPFGYCAWYIGRGFIVAAVDEEDKIVALASARPVERPGLGVLPFYFNENGSCIHIDLLVDISSDERAILAFREFLHRRFGPHKTVTMFRHKEEALHVYPARKFWDNILRLKKAKVKKDKNGKSTKNA